MGPAFMAGFALSKLEVEEKLDGKWTLKDARIKEVPSKGYRTGFNATYLWRGPWTYTTHSDSTFEEALAKCFRDKRPCTLCTKPPDASEASDSCIYICEGRDSKSKVYFSVVDTGQLGPLYDKIKQGNPLKPR